MRIGMLCDMYKPHTSGVTNHIALTKAALESLGHEVWVFTFGKLDFADDESRIVRSPGIPYGSTGYNFGLGYSRDARAALSAMDLLHVHHPFMSGRFALDLKRRSGTPVVFTNHTRYDLYSDVYAGFVPKSVRRGYIATYLRRFCSAVDATISPSAGVRDILETLGVTSRIDVVPNGIDTAPFREATPLPREQLGLSAEDIAIAYLGRLGGEKRTGMLLESFAEVARRHPEAALVFVGDGPERDSLEQATTSAGLVDRVVFAGAQPYELVPRYLASCDAATTASVSEVHPLTVIECMAAGLPVLGIDSPGVGDTIVDGESGLVVADDGSFPAAMARLVSDASLRARLADGAAARAADFDISRTIHELLAVYERVLG